jgi:siroheme synthase
MSNIALLKKKKGLGQPDRLDFLTQRLKPINTTWNKKEKRKQRLKGGDVWICSRTPKTCEEIQK